MHHTQFVYSKLYKHSGDYIKLKTYLKTNDALINYPKIYKKAKNSQAIIHFYTMYNFSLTILNAFVCGLEKAFPIEMSRRVRETCPG